jgi:hypothetical protein
MRLSHLLTNPNSNPTTSRNSKPCWKTSSTNFMLFFKIIFKLLLRCWRWESDRHSSLQNWSDAQMRWLCWPGKMVIFMFFKP